HIYIRIPHLHSFPTRRSSDLLPSRGIRFSSLISGTNHAISGSRGWTTTGKPKVDGWTPLISEKVLPSSEETKIPLWCCTHMRCGDRKSRRLNSSHVSISYAVF